ncbi:glycoside hydrolase family 3 C-terminal domain-containing protein [Nocardiopsis sp. N85]|uniref:beta-glucosidase family protein n=1 Tax=Nocardiopsis sp. N85 TaxID=3029400 RepID=UPI00237F1097|nr:glycoside hydrolase family 3 C-terminal domain-containing protein [Nocardiopsis sp. N85]MDE3720624.1 glycoside hydrolase family 3 C-terminal domain-containing protein [Nocardiopsis sp. N85]
MTTSRRPSELVAELSLEEKVRLVSGGGFTTTTPLEGIGLRPLWLSDGPSGVRGPVWDERDPSLCLPSPTALASSWDTELAREYGTVIAAEASRKKVDVVFGPVINMHRSPLGGRHFEAFSEDPELTAALAAAYVRGLQENGVAAAPKHYVANDSETDRMSLDVRVSERALREVYLLPFERVVEAGTWALMSAYNAVNGTPMTEHPLLEEPLNRSWGFDGAVVSDFMAVRGTAAASASLDLAMPGPSPVWSEALLTAVREGRVSVRAIDRKVERLLGLAARVGALEGTARRPSAPVSGRDFARRASAEGMVLLRNEAALPLPASLKSLAVIGHNAGTARVQGGGSATVVPDRVVSPLEGLRAALPDTRVGYALGAIVQEDVEGFAPELTRDPVTGRPGVRATFLDAEGEVVFSEHRRSSALYWMGDERLRRARRLVLRTALGFAESGDVLLGFATAAMGRLSVSGRTVLKGRPDTLALDPAAAVLSPPALTTPLSVTAGESVDVVAEFEMDPDRPLTDVFSAILGTAPVPVPPADLIAEAVAAAREAEAAVVVVGTNTAVESEGHDRTGLALPGHQDALVSAVAAVNPRTVVVVNAGAPVLMPWREEVAAVLLGYFGGQEFGNALADVLLGEREPGGRLPTTWAAHTGDVPVLDVTPDGGLLSYDEGVHIGYRAWLRDRAEPAHPFGFGLGYTSWRLEGAELLTEAGTGPALRVEITNTGGRPGKEVVQVYAERPDSRVDRPVRWLVGFRPVRAEAGERTTVDIPVRPRSLAHWDGEWVYEPGDFRLRVGTSVADLALDVTVGLDGEGCLK